MPNTHPHPAPLTGDEAELYTRYHHGLVRHLTATVNAPKAVIEDARQNAWSTLIRTQPRRETIYAWLRVVATREAWALAKRERRERTLDTATGIDDEPGDIDATPWMLDPRQDADRHLEALHALELVAELPERQRRLFALQLAGFTYHQIAHITRDTPRTVDRQLRRAHHHLHTLRAEHGRLPSADR